MNNNKTKIAFYSVLVGITLTLLKTVVGLLTGSLGILSEALHSLLDLGAALITYFSVKISTKPADLTHQYGHGKVENISALAEAILLLITCVWIIQEAVSRLLGKDIHVEASFWSFFVMIVSIILDIYISKVLYKGAKDHSSQALEADALHYSSDILSSSVVLIGLVGVKIGYPKLDSISALGVAILVAIASIRLGKKAIEELVDKAPQGLSDKISQSVMTLQEVGKVDQVRVRNSGGETFIDLIASAKRSLSLEKTHELADKIEDKIKEIVPKSDILIHFHPSKDGESIEDSVKTISSRFPKIQEIHNIIYYQDSENHKYFLSLHVKLDPTISLKEAHELIDNLEDELKKEIPQIEEIQTHLETLTSVGDGKKLFIPLEKLSILKNQVMEDKKLKEIHDITLHKSPKGEIICCHILIDSQSSLEEAHKIATNVEEKIKKIFPTVSDVIVHTEPFL